MKKFSKIVLDDFCHRQFKEAAVGHLPYDKQKF